MSVSDWQFEVDGAVFGCDTTVDVTGWDTPGSDTRDQDQPSGFGDFTVFGRDRKAPGAWGFRLSVKEPDEASALAALAPLAKVWDAEATRLAPQRVLPLRYRIGGRTRTVFGRPRRFTPIWDNLIFGRVPVVADFQLAEPWSYADVEQSVQLTTAATQQGTTTSFPLSFPFLWGATAGSPRHGQITVGGDRPTWLRATVTGPVGTTMTDPYLIVAGEVVQLRGVVAADEQIVVSSLPWEQGVFRADGSAASVYLDPSSRLSQLRVPPGTHTVSFGGIDNTGTGRVTVAWRDAYTSI